MKLGLRPKQLEGLKVPHVDVALIPTEVLMKIVGHLNLQEISKTSRVCRAWYSILTPHIYRKIQGHPPLSPERQPKFQIDLLLRTCIENPALGSQIKDFSLMEGEGIEVAKWQTEGRVVTDRTRQTIESYLETTHLQPQGRWKEALQSGDIGAFILLLISRLPALDTLAFNYNPDLPSALLNDFFGLGKTGEPKIGWIGQFPDLKSLKLVYGALSSQSSIPLAPLVVFMSVFGIPNLQELSLEIAVYVSPGWFESPIFSYSNLVRLDLPACEANETSLAWILRTTPKLQFLRYDRCIDVDPGGRRPEHHCYWDLGTLHIALLPLRHQLRELRLSFLLYASTAMEVTNPSEHWGVRGRAWDWTEFSGLQTLEIPFLAYADSDDPEKAPPLPSDLREVWFGDDMADHTDYRWGPKVAISIIEQLVTDRSALAPRLAHIGLVNRQDDRGECELVDWDSDDMARWHSIIKGAGLSSSISQGIRW